MIKLILAILLIPSLCWGATATWEMSTTGATPDGYVLEMWEKNSPGIILGRWIAPDTTQVIPDSKFMPGKEYTFRVFAYNGMGVSQPSPTADFMVGQAPYQPPTPVTPPDVTLPPAPEPPAGMELQSAVYTFTPVP